MKNKHIILIAIAAYAILLSIIGVGIFQLDEIRKKGQPPMAPQIHVEPSSISVKLNQSDMVIKLVRAIFDQAPRYFNFSLAGLGMTDVVNITKTNTSNIEYLLYVNATNPGSSRNSTNLEGYISIYYNFSNGKENHTKTIPMQVIINNKKE